MKKVFNVTLWILLAPLFLCFIGENYLLWKGYRCNNEKAISAIAPELRPLYYQCGWSMGPSKGCSHEDKNASETVWANGQRKSRPNIEKQSPTNILAVGCSYTFGMGVSDEETFIYRLNEAFPNVTFDNLGVVGYGTYQCLMTMNYFLEQGNNNNNNNNVNKKYDIVLYCTMGDHFFRNDNPSIRNSDHFKGVCIMTPYVDLKDDRLVYHSSLDQAWPLERYSTLVNFVKRIYMGRWLEKDKLTRNRDFAINNRIYQLLTDEMQKSCDKYKTKLIIVNLDPPGRNKISQISGFTQKHCYMDVSFPEVDMPSGRVAQNMKYHPKGKIHKKWAEQIAEKLKKTGVK